MTDAYSSSRLVAGVRTGQQRSIARMISRIELGAPGVDLELAELYGSAGRAHVVGVTGAPGSGKSSLVSALAASLRRDGKLVGILAVDPSSPFSGGALLGDRIRMSDHSGDGGVYIRSMATRGALGGLARATTDAITVLDAAGMELVLVETVGVGQAEVDIVRTAHTTLVVSIPGTGDEIQTIKAGVLEIADIHVVNKADRDGANRIIRDLTGMLRLGPPTPPGEWRAPVLGTVATEGRGIDALAAALHEHYAFLAAGDGLEQRERAMASARVSAIAQNLVAERLTDSGLGDRAAQILDEVYHRTLDPFSAATALVRVTT
ncbi:transporter [Pseudonocardia sulfidoxydans NBRC 16205]|uniref:Transporter n=1 Tax=Pseudonocardia sulfidoxydans NBRC 16205 TaxID=1223511 RepID=A0A511DPV8_9PSEU|nr:methylmalonyl Co-A mutase-associated GTPase MeaB [Pseudonocardia sulfidoxydans]GEL26860.1 transporter [Pseudonocardia sulfidoxydans NBRC 16205]